MPLNTVTLFQLMTKCRERTDMVNSTFVTDSELKGWINIGMCELHEILVNVFEAYYVKNTGEDPFLTSQGYADYTLPGDNPGTLPTDFYKVVGVDLSMGAGFEGSIVVYRMRPYSFQERDAYSNPLMTSARSTNTFYNIRGNQIHFIPKPSIGAKVRLHYIPEPVQFVESGTTDNNKAISEIAPAVCKGWEEFVINGVSAKMIMKEEGDPTPFLKMQAGDRVRLESNAGQRDAGETKAIRDVTVGTLQANYLNWG